MNGIRTFLIVVLVAALLVGTPTLSLIGAVGAALVLGCLRVAGHPGHHR